MSKHLNFENSSSEIFDDLVNQVIDAIDNKEYDSIIWVEDVARKYACDDGSEFYSEYVPRILEKVSTKKRMDLDRIRKRMKDKIKITGGLSYGE